MEKGGAASDLNSSKRSIAENHRYKTQKILQISRDATFHQHTSVRFLRGAFLSHLLTEIHHHSRTADFALAVGGAPVRRRAGREVDAGGGGNVPKHLLGEEGEVLPQLRHADLQLVPLAQQLLLLTNLEAKR